MNKWLEYYGKHDISPVKQNIENIVDHYKKREKLYRQLGMPTLLFQDKKILEIGAGSGYNTLAFMEWGGVVDIVEANPTGINDMQTLFNAQNISPSNYTIHNIVIEDFQTENKYDIIICEGFIHAVDNFDFIIDKMKKMLSAGGVIVITCMDEMSMFVEQIKRYVFQNMLYLNNIQEFEEQVEFGVKMFSAGMEKLCMRSRSVADWVQDDMINPTFSNKNYLSFDKAIYLFGKDYKVLGSSQKIFTDFSWYKDITYNDLDDYEKQYKKRKHIFLKTGIEECDLIDKENVILEKSIKEIREKCIEFEATKEDLREDICDLLTNIIEVSYKINFDLGEFVKESIDILVNLDQNMKFDRYSKFLDAVGRTQQYLSVVKNRYGE